VLLLRVLLLSGGALGGCAAPVGVLEPVPASAPDTTHLDMLVATTRARSPEPGVAFSGERGEASLSNFVVSIPPDESRQIGQVQWPQSLPPDPNRDFATLQVDALSTTKQEDAWLRAHGGKSRRVLVFIHGFNTRFETALFSFAQIFHDSGEVDATNNGSERKLRPCVIQRKVTNGYRAMWAAQAEADVRTTIDTARLSMAQTPSRPSSTPWPEAPEICASKLGVGNYAWGCFLI